MEVVKLYIYFKKGYIQTFFVKKKYLKRMLS